jgi:hypothetical protein
MRMLATLPSPPILLLLLLFSFILQQLLIITLTTSTPIITPGAYSSVFLSTLSAPLSIYINETDKLTFLYKADQLAATQDYRLHDVNIRTSGYYTLWSGVFLRGNYWDSRILVEKSSFSQFLVDYNYKIARGWRLIDVDVYREPFLGGNGLRFVGVYRPGTGNNALYMSSWNDFTRQAKILANMGVRIVAVDTFIDNNGLRQWIGAFQQYDDAEFSFWIDMTSYSLGYRNHVQINNGLCLIKLINYAYDRYAAIWSNEMHVFAANDPDYQCIPASTIYTTSIPYNVTNNLIHSLAPTRTLVSMDVTNFPCYGSGCGPISISPSPPPLPGSCQLFNGMTISECFDLKYAGCLVNWHGRGCRGPRTRDGGCQLDGWCGYKCQRLCVSDSSCQWTSFGGGGLGLGVCKKKVVPG